MFPIMGLLLNICPEGGCKRYRVLLIDRGYLVETSAKSRAELSPENMDETGSRSATRAGPEGSCIIKDLQGMCWVHDACILASAVQLHSAFGEHTRVVGFERETSP